MRVLVTFAVQAEFAPWREARRFRKASGEGPDTVFRAEVCGSTVDVGFTGIGWRGLPPGVGRLAAARPEAWISSGLAGALSDSARPGEVFAPRAVVSEAAEGGEAEQVEVDRELHALALGCGARDADRLLTAGRVLTRASEKKARAARASLVDMESFAVVGEARRLGAPSVVIRAVSDSAEEDLPVDFNRTLGGRGGVSVGRVLFELAKNPRATPAMIRFGRQSRLAAESLAAFLDRYVESLAAKPLAAAEVAAR